MYNLYVGVDRYDQKKVTEKEIEDKLLCHCDNLGQARETFRVLCGEQKQRANTTKKIRRYYVYCTKDNRTVASQEYYSGKYLEEFGENYENTLCKNWEQV